MRAVSLFSGVGGFELGMQRAGIETVLQVEIDPWCNAVLERHWPEVPRFGDIRTVTREAVQAMLAREDAGRVPSAARGADGQAFMVQDLRERIRAGASQQENHARTAETLGAENEVPNVDSDAERIDRTAEGLLCDLRTTNGATEGRSRSSDRGSPGAFMPPLQHQAGGDRRSGVPDACPTVSEQEPVGGDVCEVDAGTLERRGRYLAEAGRSADAEQFRHGRRDAVDDIDLVFGGWPCQDVSVAGKRAGFRGARSGLWHEVRRVLSELRPRWFVGENVPGLFSSDQGLDFLRVLMDLDEFGYGVAWRVCDARWFGVPQRRRRVFLVGCLGDAPRAQAVLAVCESCGGHPQTGGEAGQDVAPTLDDGARRASVELPLIAVAATLSGGNHEPGVNLPGRHKEDDENLIVGSQRDAGQARPLVARGSGYRMDLESETFVVADLRNGTADEATAMPLQSGGMGDERGRSINSIPHVVASAVRASDGHHGHSSPRGDGGDNLVAGAGVRRLTPLECERLQGWPDNWTKLTADGKPIPDSHRYRMIGNGVVAPVAEWIGHRLVEVDAWP